jgi:lipopolysaccharide/colanic/teichoic acid biosynthesis glycosyltransferase
VVFAIPSSLRKNGCKKILKRALDIVLSSFALLLLAPLLMVIAAAVFLDSGSPVLFTQKRVGRSFRIFRIRKFRTMRAGEDGALVTVSGDQRVTRVGKLLRRTKLDELPQLWNVLCGDMSLVGPRPEIPQYVSIFKDRYASILRIRPGITDLASIAFSNEEEVLRRSHDPMRAYVEQVLPAKLDLADKYVLSHSVLGDLVILFRTVLKLI